MTFARSYRIAVFSAAILASSANAQLQGNSLSTRWNTPTTMTRARAAEVLAREALGQSVSVSDLFEARKHLRSDRMLSSGGSVMSTVATDLVDDSLDHEVRLRSFPVLHWLEPTVYKNSDGAEVLLLRGESLILLALSSDPNLAATVLQHFTFNEEWKWCGSSLCLIPLPGAVRSTITYDLAVPLASTAPGEAQSSGLVLAAGVSGSVFSQTTPALDPSGMLGPACDPLPSQTRFTAPQTTPARMFFSHTAERTERSKINRVLCGFFSLSSGPDARFTYLAGNQIAAPPASAAASASVQNPLDFQIFQ